jgi:hypothetical protein
MNDYAEFSVERKIVTEKDENRDVESRDDRCWKCERKKSAQVLSQAGW